MKLLFMRHGESKSQAKLVQNSDPDILNNLTSDGVQQVKDASKNFKGKLNAVYSSPYIRTKETAQIFLDTIKQPLSIITDERLREIDYGFHGGDTKKHPEMIEVATKQIARDYEIRFGRTGENKREIVTRFFNFMIDIFNKHNAEDTILAVTHGRAISIIEYEFCKINNITCELSGTKNAQLKEIILTQETINKAKQHLQQINKISKQTKSSDYLNKIVSVVMDRPLGTKHPKHGFVYEVNYGYIPNTVSGDGEEIDAYVLGIDKPLKEFTGRCVAIIHRTNDNDDKLVVVPDGLKITNQFIEQKTKFQEQWFKHEIIR